MEGTCEKNSEVLRPGVFELPGEPAVVINGVPDSPAEDGHVIPGISQADGNRSVKPRSGAANTEKTRDTGFGEWLEGRDVQKLFGDNYYSGTVTEFDRETGWYRVVYEDGDFEDLEWHELQDVLLPLDITVPLKSLALKIIRNSQKPEAASVRKLVGERKRGGKIGSRRIRE